VRTCVVTLGSSRQSRIISLSREPEHTHICKVPFAMEDNLFAGSGD